MAPIFTRKEILLIRFKTIYWLIFHDQLSTNYYKLCQFSDNSGTFTVNGVDLAAKNGVALFRQICLFFVCLFCRFIASSPVLFFRHSENSHVSPVAGYRHLSFFFFNRNIFFPAQAEYSYFSDGFRLKIFSWIFLDWKYIMMLFTV